MTNVHGGVKNTIIGKKVNPTMKLAPQFVLVLIPEPRERTFRGKSSLCIHGTLPRPRAYAPTYSIILARTNIEAVRSERGIASWAAAEAEGSVDRKSDGSRIKKNPKPQSRRPIVMIGMEERSILRLPIRSMRNRAAHVMMKLVTATTRDVNVGLSKPRIVKTVAEKYMREF
jgi:hypothetical protein